MKNFTCKRCHGKGRHSEKLCNTGRVAMVICDMCTNGIVTSEDHGRYLRSIGGPAYDRWLAKK